jgi:ubiquinone/menaquinone biosynthesis C-methylase UbiE
MNVRYWIDRYKAQNTRTVGHCSLSKEQFEKKTNEAIQRLSSCIARNKISGDKLLDFGCGWARLINGYLTACRHVYGIDVVPQAIKMARDRYPIYDFHVFDGKNVPFPNKYFDIVLTWTVLQHVPDEDLSYICRDIARVMAGGAWLILYENVSTWNKDKPHIWFRTKYKYSGLFDGSMRLVEDTMVDAADGNDEKHILMVFKKEK